MEKTVSLGSHLNDYKFYVIEGGHWMEILRWVIKDDLGCHTNEQHIFVFETSLTMFWNVTAPDDVS